MTKRFDPLGLVVLLAVGIHESGPSAAGAASYVVDRLTDAAPAGGGVGSDLFGDLRYALANTRSGDVVTFSVSGTIVLAAGLPALTRNISVHGPGADRLTVRGAGGAVVAVGSGASAVVSGLTITGGHGNGGGVFNQGTLTLTDTVVTGNVAGDPTNGGGTGAGIWNVGGTARLTLNGCTVSGNSATGNLSYAASRGGGIANYGTLTLNGSTISGNSAAQGFGGGIFNAGTLVLNSATISGNSAAKGGGVHANGGRIDAGSTILAGNTGGDLNGALASQGHNLIGDNTGGSGFRPDLGDLLDVDPLLGPLRDNGGPTPTMALLPGSPGVDAGDNAGAAPFDQRGPGHPRIVGGKTDIGAVEGAVPASITAERMR